MPVSMYLTEHLKHFASSSKKAPRNRLSLLSEELILRLLKAPRQQDRGHIIGAGYLARVLLENQTNPNEYELVTKEWLCKPISSALASIGSPVPVTSVYDRLPGLAQNRIDLWFDLLPTSDSPLGERIRNRSTGAIFPVAHLFHGLSLPTMLYDTFLRLLLEGTYPCDSWIMTSTASQRALTKMGEHIAETFASAYDVKIPIQHRVDLIPLPVDTEFFAPGNRDSLRQKLRLPQNRFVMLYLGRVSPLKADLAPLLRVVHMIAITHKKPILLIVGGTPEDAYDDHLRKMAVALQIGENVRFEAHLPNDLRRDYLAAADVFISPSDSVQESFGITPVEAMACGTPQIVPDWNGYHDTVRHGKTGFLVPTYWTACDEDLRDTALGTSWIHDHLSLGQSVATDLDILEQYLLVLINNPALHQEMSLESRRTAVSHYGPKIISQQYRELWTELLSLGKTTHRRNQQVDFMRPRYHHVFGHYASRTLNEDDILALSTRTNDSLPAGLKASLPGHLNDYRIIEEDVLKLIVDVFREPADTPDNPLMRKKKDVRLKHIIAAVPLGTEQHTKVVRHVMWLIKYGVLKVVSSSSATKVAVTSVDDQASRTFDAAF